MGPLVTTKCLNLVGAREEEMGVAGKGRRKKDREGEGRGRERNEEVREGGGRWWVGVVVVMVIYLLIRGLLVGEIVVGKAGHFVVDHAIIRCLAR